MLDLYFNPKYGKLYENIDGKCETFFFECEYGCMQNTFIIREIKWNIDEVVYYDIMTPYGYGGPIITQCTSVESLIREYQIAFTQYCKNRNIIAEFIRFHLYDNIDVRENYWGKTMEISDNVVVNTTGSFDYIWMNYEQKVRKNVKKAVRNNLEILVENNIEHLDDFLKIYYDTMNRNSANSYYFFKREYFENIASNMTDNFVYFHVYKEGVIISTELVLCSKNYAYSFLGGTKIEYYDYRPNDFLKNEIIQWCNKTGRSKFILGGGYHNGDGIYQYKRGFTHDSDVAFYVGSMIYNNDIYHKMVEFRKLEKDDFDESSNYFPLYRA